MFTYLARKILGSPSDRIVRNARSLVNQINALEKQFQTLDNSELQGKTAEFRLRLNNGEYIDHILPEAFATVREASCRVLGMKHFDVQLIGGIILHKGMIAEMKTGEGKTLVATMPVYLNALAQGGVHVVTVNDYLAKRDAEWMGELYNFLGLSVGCLTNSTSEIERKSAYMADITYGTNNEFGFDYLRDNLKYSISGMVQRTFNYAIIDEVDSILIDEARTPLIISGPTEDNIQIYKVIDRLVKKLRIGEFEIDEKSRSIMMTDQGHDVIEEMLHQFGLLEKGRNLYDIANISLIHYINQALRANHLFHKNVDYIIKGGKVMIIDEFTGRIMEGRRYSEGLHQALEAKEGVNIQNENQTLASITFQNYFRMYPKLAGMTGTAMTESAEFSDIYGLEVVEIPTNVPVIRKDEDDAVFRTAKEKYNAIITEIETAHKAGQPVLVGTISIEKSEYLSKLLKKHKIKHNVLNAKYHDKEAEIIAQAGRISSVTIATNIAGRGTDIMLGGNVKMLAAELLEQQHTKEDIENHLANDAKIVKELGGLLVIGTERHESRRIDNQLRGRSGRQGDPGRTKFFLSLEDDLMRLFGSEKVGTLLAKLGLKEGEAIIHPWISKSLEKAQQRIEGRNYEIRKNLLRFDNVMNEQRKIIYAQRIEIMSADNLLASLKEMINNLNLALAEQYIPSKSYPEEWDIAGLEKELFRIYGSHISLITTSREEILDYYSLKIANFFNEKFRHYDSAIINEALRKVFLMSLDHLWKDHLHSLDHMRSGINLRAYAHKDPLSEYKVEAFNLFQNMLNDLNILIVERSAKMQLSYYNNSAAEDNGKYNSNDNKAIPDSPPSRNTLCYCGSGKKYKHCHGAIQ